MFLVFRMGEAGRVFEKGRKRDGAIVGGDVFDDLYEYVCCAGARNRKVDVFDR